MKRNIPWFSACLSWLAVAIACIGACGFTVGCAPLNQGGASTQAVSIQGMTELEQTYATTVNILSELRAAGKIDDSQAFEIEKYRATAESAIKTARTMVLDPNGGAALGEAKAAVNLLVSRLASARKT